jgi:hypothetical protein
VRPEWVTAPIAHRFTETSRRVNSRSFGLVDMAGAIRDKRAERASAQMACHCLGLMEGRLASAAQGRYVGLASTCTRPAPMPVDLPDGQRTG